MLRLSDILSEKSPVTGAWICSAIVGGHYTHRTYYGYTRREAVSLFRQEMKGAT